MGIEAAAAPLELDAQYRVLREETGFLARPGRRILRVRGSEAAEFLQGQLTNDVEALAPGEGQYSALLDRKGHMQADLRVLRVAADEFGLGTEDVAGDAVHRHLSLYKVGRDADVADLSAEQVLVSLIGPGAVSIAGAGPIGPEYAHREAELAGHRVRLIATDVGLDLLLDASELEPVAAALSDAGAERVSEEAAEIVRVETGRPRFGAEMTTATMPAEAGIESRAVSFTKGCYIGQETVARLHYRGKPNRHLRGLRLAAAATAGETVALGERELGTIGTAVLSPAHGPIALAILRREAEPGASVRIGASGSGEVVELPF